MAKKPPPPAEQADDLLVLNAARFGRLFEGNQRSSGRYDPARDRAWTEYVPAGQADYQAHLSGRVGLGIVPIQDDDSCVWAAIDIDGHDSDEDLPINDYADAIAIHKLPLIACRSKSGGVHVYLFLDRPQPAGKIRIFMEGWARMIGAGGMEIFPKQGRLTVGQDGQKNKGNWLNLPYLDGDATIRYAVVEGRKLSLMQFLDLAEKNKVSDAGLRALSMVEHPDAPPCVQKMFAHGVAQGHRNEALYNIVVYHKKANPNDYDAKATAANTAVFAKPLPRAEMQRTINSASRPDCTYRCNEEPIRSLCDRETCVTRKFGITSGDMDRLNTTDALPIFTDLVKYMGEPVRWEFKIDGVRIMNVKTMVLLDWRALREVIADRLTKIVPLIKNTEWERILGPLMQTARIVETPDDATVSGVIRSRLREFASRVNFQSPGSDKEERKALLRGLPVVQLVEGDRSVVFRGPDFVNFLKRTRTEELKGVDLWFAVKAAGVSHTRIRIPGAKAGEDNINVWYLPVKEVLQDLEHTAEAREFKSDI